ncbi:hypothetical protein IOD16_13635 [Saccharothrix sp. 6-C]|nr:hypothetical protein [Saccharothrix sp. 6-C]QQQ79364.1 hypothetical protein IOD16_13635 [Saccharothrix sp. 6-C]
MAPAIAPVSPARAADGLCKITTTQFSISHHDIDCVRGGRREDPCPSCR